MHRCARWDGQPLWRLVEFASAAVTVLIFFSYLGHLSLVWLHETLGSSIEIFGRVVVRVHLTTQFGCDRQAASHELISPIVRDVDLEEARVWLRECQTIHVCHQAHFMLVLKTRQVDGEAAASPHEFKISTSFNVAPCLKHTPESWNDFMIWSIIGECCDALEAIHGNVLFACATRLQSLPRQQVHNARVVLNHLKEAFTNDLNLYGGLVTASFKHFSNKLINVALIDANRFTIFTKWNFFATAKDCSEALLYSSIEIFITECLSIVL